MVAGALQSRCLAQSAQRWSEFQPAPDGSDAHSDEILVGGVIPRTKDELQRYRKLPFGQPDYARLLRVSILGLPNAGKSTLTNQLVARRGKISLVVVNSIVLITIMFQI